MSSTEADAGRAASAIREGASPEHGLLDELAALGALGTVSGSARTTAEMAEGALEILRRATGASAGLILTEREGRLHVTARFGLGDRLLGMIHGVLLQESTVLAALRNRADPLVIDVDHAPFRPDILAETRAEGVTSILLIGLPAAGELAGILGLGWRDPNRLPGAVPDRGSATILLQAAALIAVNLQNALLVERLEAALAAERRITGEHAALASLTLVADMSASLPALADTTLSQVVAFLGAAAGAYALLGPDDRLIHVAHVGVGDDFIDNVRGVPASDMTPVRRFLAGDGPYLQPYVGGGSKPDNLQRAREQGFTAYASLPIRIADRFEGLITVWFRRPVEAIAWSDRTVEAISRVISISLANFRLRDELVAAREEYRTLFRESPLALVVQTEAGDVVDANDAAFTLYRTDLSGLASLAREHRDEIGRKRWERYTERVRAHGTVAFRRSARRADGTTFPEEAHATRMSVRGESRLLLFVRDLTQQEQLELERLAAQKMEAIGQLASGVAHELNNPLASIVAFSHLIGTDPRLPEDLRRDAGLLAQEADRTQRIAQNLLDFARRRPPERVTIDVRPLVQSVVALQSYRLSSANIALDVDIPDDLATVDVDRGQLQQVLLNLVLNAIQSIQSAGPRGTIRIVARPGIGDAAERLVRLSVTDDGGGVSPEARPHLFEPFFTTREPGEGSGLGLAVSSSIVAAHGGRLWYEPGPGGAGATFAFELPASATAGAVPLIAGAAVDAAVESSPPIDDGAAADSPGVLVIDDEPAIRALLTKILRVGGFDPSAVENGADAIALVRARSFDAVLVDYRMPGMSGAEVIEALAGIRPELASRFAIMSGDVVNPDLREYAGERGIALLAKPFDVEDVLRVVADVTGQLRSRG